MLLTASGRRNKVGTLGWVSRADTKARVYLNFAEDWRRDFSIMVERKDAKVLQEAGLDVKALAGKRLRVRGWIQWRNGPMIRVTHVEQIELLTEAPGTTALPNPPGAPAPPCSSKASLTTLRSRRPLQAAVDRQPSLKS